jgi:uncharacterized protein (TIGR00255 family)
MKSMTGYGSAEGKVGQGQLFVEVKTVNHRFCEVAIKQPPKMGVLEPKIKKYLENKYVRGKVDVYVKEVGSLLGGVEIALDLELAKKYERAIKKLCRVLKTKYSDDILDYVDLERLVILREKAGNYERFWQQIRKLLDEACLHIDRMRRREGQFIQGDQQKRITKVKGIVLKIKESAERSLEKNKERVRRRVNNMGQMDEQRFITEVAYLGGRQDITEEVIRLESHINQYKKLLSQKEAVGRKLDFLLQEINREVNTIGSKAADVNISRLVVDCKSELERLREQVQNVE